MKRSKTPPSDRKRVVAGCRGSGCCPTVYWCREGLEIVIPAGEVKILGGRLLLRLNHSLMRKVIEQRPDPACLEYVPKGRIG